MKIYKSKGFAKFSKKERITDSKLCEVVAEAEQGLISADYGDGLIKQRIARPNEGKSGGYRAIIAFRKGERTFFLYGYPKSELEDISDSDKNDFKALAIALLNATDDEIETLTEKGKYIEVKRDD